VGYEHVDGAVEGGDLELKAGLLAVGAGGCELTVKRQYLVDEADHLAMHRLISGVGEVDGTYGELLDKLSKESYVSASV
jgi:hypothetical protein